MYHDCSYRTDTYPNVVDNLTSDFYAMHNTYIYYTYT